MMKEFGRKWSSMDSSARAPFYKVAEEGKFAILNYCVKTSFWYGSNYPNCRQEAIRKRT